MMAIGEQVAATAEDWIDVPFHWQGSVRGGCDCKGLIAGVARELGRPEAASLEALAGDYGIGKPVPTRRLREGLAFLFDRVPLRQAQDERDSRQAGDVLLLRMGGAAQHLAICAPRDGAPDRIIEAMPSAPHRVRPGRASTGRIDSIWRWRS